MNFVCDTDSLRAYKKKFNFFETPDAIAVKMAELLDDLGRSAKVLEPSAGRGKLIEAVRAVLRFDTQRVSFCEIQPEICANITTAERVGGDFLALTPDETYDAVIMNPPFAKRQDIAHVEHAFKFLKPGGKLVALVSVPCAEYLDEEFMGHVFVREMFEKGFAETSVTTVMFLIHKPLDGAETARDLYPSRHTLVKCRICDETMDPDEEGVSDDQGRWTHEACQDAEDEAIQNELTTTP